MTESAENTIKRPIAEREVSDLHVDNNNKKQKPNWEKGIAYIKKEYLIVDDAPSKSESGENSLEDDDEEQASERLISQEDSNGKNKSKKKRGQNKKRDLTQPKDSIKLCPSVINVDDKGEVKCTFGERCRWCHDIDEYLQSKPKDIDGECPNFKSYGYCKDGIKCRWLQSHFDEKNKKLTFDFDSKKNINEDEVNKLKVEDKNRLVTGQKNKGKKFDFEKSNIVIDYLNKISKLNSDFNNSKKNEDTSDKQEDQVEKESRKEEEDKAQAAILSKKENQFDYIEAPIKPWEKKKLNYNRLKIVSPLTTVGNLPFRRLMKQLYNVDITYSEMALSLPLIQGNNSEWALMKAHKSEIPGFGAQIATSKPWQAIKATELISEFTTDINEINLNSGCPIDLLYKQGAGSGLLDQPAKSMRMLKGMNLVSKDIPITYKIRMGTRDDHPNADSLVKRVLYGNENSTGISDVGAIILHGRSRQQRYSKLANWDYISDIGKIVQEYNHKQEENKDSYDTPNKVFFVGNGDCYNFQDWYKAVENPNIDSVMIARGALIKPWIFEEIDSQQYLDKSATERLEIIKTYANNAINHFGSDEYGVSLSRRFLCEWLSFTHRYLPVGILEKLPNQLNERPSKWRGRNELETLLASDDYKDWIKISEMFLGPAHKDFKFIPKHKSNAY